MSINPFKLSTSTPGEGTIHLELFPPYTHTLSTLDFTYPLKLISPSSSTSLPYGILVFLLSYGGGLVSGDHIFLKIKLESYTKLSLVTQGSTKVFKASAADIITKQELRVVIEPGASLLLLPDPVQPFAESNYEQKQIFSMHPSNSNLFVLDWVTEGRTARGEKWSFDVWKGRNEVWTLPSETVKKSNLLLRDNVILETNGKDHNGLEAKMDGMGVVGTLIIRGPLFKKLGEVFMEGFKAMPRIGGKDWSHPSDIAPALAADEVKKALRLAQEIEDGVLWSAAPIRGCVLVKFGAREVQGARNWLRDIVLDEGTIEKEFGEGALLCLR
jgi:urease accessory protein